jgi:hypothetical protein
MLAVLVAQSEHEFIPICMAGGVFAFTRNVPVYTASCEPVLVTSLQQWLTARHSHSSIVAVVVDVAVGLVRRPARPLNLRDGIRRHGVIEDFNTRGGWRRGLGGMVLEIAAEGRSRQKRRAVVEERRYERRQVRRRAGAGKVGMPGEITDLQRSEADEVA